MGTFTIYAFVVTGLYIFYMGAVMMMDIAGDKKKKKAGVEEFSTDGMVGDTGEESSMVIDETEDGFRVHVYEPDDQSCDASSERSDGVDGQETQEVSENEETADDAEVFQDEQPVDDLDDELSLLQESDESLSAFERVKAVQRQDMVGLVPDYSHVYNSKEYAVINRQPIGHLMSIAREIIGNGKGV